MRSLICELSSRLEESRKRRVDIIENMPGIFIELDSEGKAVFANRAADFAIGQKTFEIAGSHFNNFVASEWHERVSEVLSAAMNGKPSKNVELLLLLENGRENFFEFNAVPVIEDGITKGCFLMGRDTDEKRNIAEELHKTRQEAEEASSKLKKTISDLEEFALLAVRRELKMQELRELFVSLKDEHEIKREFPS